MAGADVNNLLYIRNEPPDHPRRGLLLFAGLGPATQLYCVQLCRDYASLWQTSARTLRSKRIQMFPRMPHSWTITQSGKNNFRPKMQEVKLERLHPDEGEVLSHPGTLGALTTRGLQNCSSSHQLFFPRNLNPLFHILHPR